MFRRKPPRSTRGGMERVSKPSPYKNMYIMRNVKDIQNVPPTTITPPSIPHLVLTLYARIIPTPIAMATTMMPMTPIRYHGLGDNSVLVTAQNKNWQSRSSSVWAYVASEICAAL
eukprot:3305241-Ditylum_brightwellii.AAC.1